MVRTAVVSTQRGVRTTIRSFLRWHLDALHFDCVYLYFDDPNFDAESIAIAQSFGSDRVIVCKATESFRVHEKYFELPSWDDVQSTVRTMVQSRQRLNCEHCVQRCAASGIDCWLLHIDADELFMPSRGEDARAQFQKLDATGCWQFTFRNLEAVPTKSMSDAAAAAPEPQDFFESVRIFKQHEDALPAGSTGMPNPNVHSALSFWLERTRLRLGAPVWFFFYSNGKSAIKVDASGGRWRGLTCAGVHGWGYTDAGLAHDLDMAKGWRTNIQKVAARSKLRHYDSSVGAVILHYACCTSQGFAAKDWRALGYLGCQGAPWARRWHEMQTQECTAATELSPAEEKAAPSSGSMAQRQDSDTRLMEEHEILFGIDDDAELSRQIEAGVLLRIDRVCDHLGGLTSAQHHVDAIGTSAELEEEREEDREDEEEDDEDDEVVDEEAARLRAEAHARREQRRVRWAEAGRRLASDGFAIIDDFLGADAIGSLRQAVLELRSSQPSAFVLGKTGGGKDGKSAKKFAEAVVRGDQVAVLGDGEEGRVPGLGGLLRQADELVREMAKESVPALRKVTSRSRPMLACYPGNGARYVRHLDNPGGAGSNGRLLTMLVYLNPGWQQVDGGALRLHRLLQCGDGDADANADGSQDTAHVDIAPLLDRCVCFWSDHRTPHEVLPAHTPRWAVSVWYHHDEQDGREGGRQVDMAGMAGAAGEDVQHESGMSEVSSFGRSTEEVESFLLAMAAMKGGDEAARNAPPKARVYQENLRSW